MRKIDKESRLEVSGWIAGWVVLDGTIKGPRHDGELAILSFKSDLVGHSDFLLYILWIATGYRSD